jgi:riboflavin kinase/FMN adenylyltransferase
MIKRHQSYSDLNVDDRGCAIAIGNFDGVHLGHQSVLALARAASAEHDAPLGVLTFEPHPRAYFAPDAPPFRLMNATAKAHRLGLLGVDHVYEVQFDKAFASLSAEEFIQRVLIDGLDVRHVVVGADFCFGKGRSGSPKTLRDAGKSHGFGVTIAPLVSDATGDFSSTAIRNALGDGRPEEAARMLGHWHRFEGVVESGEKQGRALGFPTANLSLDGLHLPKFGVYAVQIDVEDGAHKGSYRGAASLGVKPTMGEFAPNLETYIFDFDGDIYDQPISVALVAFLRPELKFDTLDALIAQMTTDCEAARAALQAIG